MRAARVGTVESPGALGDRDAEIGLTIDNRSGLLEELGPEPEFRWALAPACLATRRQLRADGLCPPRGARPVAFLVWRRGRRWAGLYRAVQAVPRTPASPAVLASLDRARAALRTCRVCGRDAGYRLPDRWDRTCLDCQGPEHAA